MGKVVDFNRAHEEKQHERKEARVKAMRQAFRAARQSWSSDGEAPKGLARLNKKKKNKNNNNKNKNKKK